MTNICNRCQRDCKGDKPLCGTFKSVDDKGFRREFRQMMYDTAKRAVDGAVAEEIESRGIEDAASV
jgi:hypothetical protein